MSFPRLKSYVQSGVDWLGEVPTHWRVVPLKHLATFRSGGTPNKDRVDFWSGDVPWASAKDLKADVLADTIDHLSTLAVDSGAAALVPAGAVVVLVRGMMLARAFPVAMTAVPMAINQDLKALVVRPGLQSRYLAWLLRGASEESLSRIDEAGHGTKALRMEAWTSMLLPLPPEGEQELIANFLDRETAKIDALVEEQRRLIQLLKEKRQAVISHAVTRGLDPNSPTLAKEILNAVMDALTAHETMSKQALNSEKVRDGLKEALLGPAQLYEALREKGASKPG